MAAKPWLPDVVTILQLIYVRANMIGSGKMFVANMMPGHDDRYVRLEPVVPRDRSSAGFHLRQLFPTPHQLGIAALFHPDRIADRLHGRGPYTQACLGQLGRGALIGHKWRERQENKAVRAAA